MKHKHSLRMAVALLAAALPFVSCRKGEFVLPSTSIEVGGSESNGAIKGFFLLNEGNMGSNKASLDYYDYETGIYHVNIYPERNPGVTYELGDVGHDLQIYGNKLYAVINCSNLVEVMDVATARHEATVYIPNCRYIVFDDGFAYISSYAGPVQIDPAARLGYVAKVDTATMRIVDTCTVGYQPEEMVVAGDKLYVANSGGYRAPAYDRTVSVIDLATFTEIKKIDVAVNLHRMEADRFGNIYVSSRGDYYDTPSKTYVIDSRTDRVTEILHLLPNSNMTLSGDSLYVYSSQWSWHTEEFAASYAIVDTRSKKIVTRNFITDGTEAEIAIPYGIAANPDNGDLFVTDVGNYVTPGKVHCYDRHGRRKWSVTAGDIPAHIAFTRTRLRPLESPSDTGYGRVPHATTDNTL